MTFSLTTLCIAIIKHDTQHKDFQQNETQYNINKTRHSALAMLNVNLRVAYAERYVMLNVVMLSVVMLSVVMLSVVMLSVVMLSVVMLCVVMLSVIIPNVVHAECCVIFFTMLRVRLNVVTLSLIMLSVPVPIKMLHL